MKKFSAFITVILVGCTCLSQAQNQQQTKNISTFTKVWGFIKYYHPEAAKGRPDWDAEYLKTVLTVKQIADSKSFNEFIIKWYQSLPKANVSTQITQLQGDSILRVFDERDLARLDIPAVLKKNLQELYRYHLPDSSRYIDNKYKGYTLDYVYHNEDPYALPAYPDEAHRLLALARWWNIISYFYPHKAVSAPKWDEVLNEFFPQLILARNADAYRETILRLTNKISDSHTWFIQKQWNAAHGDFLNMPFDTYYAGGKFLIGYSRYDSLIKAADLKVGDEILAINGLAVSERVKQIAEYATGSNASSYYRDLGRNIFRVDSATSINVKFKRNTKILDKLLKLYTYGELYQYRIKHQRQIAQNFGNGVWYVRFCEVSNVQALKKMFTDIQQAKTVILEMRDYPNFQMVQAMWPGLVAKRVPAGADYNAVLEFPGTFKESNEQIESSPDTLGLPLFKGKLIVLVNEQTQSLAESVVLELRTRPNTIVVGRQTAGATGNMLRVDLPGGIEASYTAVKVVGVNGNFNQGKGVKLDKEITLSPAKIASVPDYLLEQAYQLALK